MSLIHTQVVPHLVQKLRRFHPQVDKVVDSTKPIIVIVKQGDVDKSKEKAADACVVAQACIRQHPIDAAIIWRTSAFLIKGNVATRYRVPASVCREIVTFDRHKAFWPGEYQLSAVSPCDRLGFRPKKTGPHRKKRVTIHPLVAHRSEGLRGLKPND